MTSQSSKLFSRTMWVALLAATALVAVFSSRFVRSSFAQQSPSALGTTATAGLSKSEIAHRYGRLPLSFEANQGQTDGQVKFLSRGPGYSLFLTSGGMVLTLQEPRANLEGTDKPKAAAGESAGTSVQQNYVLRLTMIGADPKARVEGQDQLAGKINYLIGNDQANWRTNIPTYRKVHYAEIYPKVDLVYYGNQTELEYDFIVAPGGNVQAIKFQIEGADQINVDRSGNLVLDVKKREVKLSKPVIYQLDDKGERREVKGDYVLKGKEIGFNVQSYDASKRLIIDPVLSYSTLLGAGGHEFGTGIAVDSQGNAYITGLAPVSGFPTTPGAFQTTSSSGAFVTKLNPTGSSLVYSTYLSGSNGATGTAIAVDQFGQAHVTGFTTSGDFPSVNAFRGSYNFLKSTDSGASWIGKSFSPPRHFNSLAIDPQTPSTIYAGTNGGSGVYKSTDNGISWTELTTGHTSALVKALVIDPVTPSTVYAATNAPSFGVIKTTDGGASWSTVNTGLASTGFIYSLAIDPVTPSTLYLGSNGGLFKTTNGGTTWTSSNTGLTTIAFALAIDPTTPSTIYAGGGVVFKSTNGGANWSNSSTGLSSTIHSLVIDPVNTATIYAGTLNGIFKTTNSGGTWTSASSGIGSQTIFSLAINPASPTTIYAGSGAGKIFKTVDNGSAWTPAYQTIASLDVLSLVIDPSNPSNVYAGTFTEGSGFDSEAFLAKLNDSGSGLVYSTYLGGSAADSGNGIALDSSGNAYVTGQTSSSDFLTASPFQATIGGAGDAFLAKVSSSGSALLYSTYLGGAGSDSASSVAVDGSGNAYVTGSTNSTNFPLANAFQSTIGSSFTTDAFASKFNSNGTIAYSTYLGGSQAEVGNGIAVDLSGNAYITGVTGSSNFPTLNPFQPTFGGSANDVFVTKLNSLGSGLVYSTFLGGSSNDIGKAIAVDSGGNAYVTGSTISAAFPLVPGALRTKSPFYKSVNGAGTWSNDTYGLTASGIRSIELDPTNSAVIYAATSDGVFKSVDAGRNWSAKNSGLNQADVRAAIIDPGTPSTLYIGMLNSGFGSSGVYKSINGGNSWSPMNTGLTNTSVMALAIDPSTPSTLYAGTNGSGIFKSTNGGASWTRIWFGFYAAALAVDPTNPNIIYAGQINSGSVLIKSIDGGNTWNPTPLAVDIACIRIAPTNTSTLYASGISGAYRSTDSGVTWTQLKQGFAGSIAIDPVTSTTIYLLVNTGSAPLGVFKSTDGGTTFTPQNQGLNYNPSAIAINPLAVSTIYLGAGTGNDGDAFVTKINVAGSALVYSTLLGGLPTDSFDPNDVGTSIALDSAGNAYIAGQSTSLDFPVTPDSYQPFKRAFTDAFVSKLTMSYVISGQVLDGGNAPVGGAEISLSDGASLTTFITESDGSYEFSRLREGGNFTVSAAKPNFTMAPPSQTFNNLSSNQVVNFIASATNAPFYTVSGRVTDNGLGLAGVKVTLSGSQSGLRTTDNNGNYSFTLAGGGDYTVTPAKLGFSFSPPSHSFNTLSSNQTADFTATRQGFVVTNANNHGAGSLRQAILDANANAGLDMIVFNIPGGGVQTINLLIALPGITDPVVIDATTQPGYAGSPLVELNGTQAGSGVNGFTITAGGCTIRGFAVVRFNGAGISLSTNGNNVIQANYIGLDPTGTLARGNNSGISLFKSSANTIGGTTPAERNVISANGFEGITVNGSNNQITGNFIGTNAAGSAALGNGIRGVDLVNYQDSISNNNVIGGMVPGAGNVISGNQRGVSNGANNTVIQGNLIGTNPAGTSAIGNQIGVDSSGLNTLVGGLVPAARNLISGNGFGVYIRGSQSRLQGNFVGTDITGTLALGNTGGGVAVGNQALVGGTSPEARNIISGNGSPGNVVPGYNSVGDAGTVQGNYIGTDVTGNVALANPSTGILVSGANHVIGGLVPGARNIISGNTVGLQVGGTSHVVQGNFIGLNATGNAPLPNQNEGVRLADLNGSTIGGTEPNAANTIAFNGGSGVLVISQFFVSQSSIRRNSIFSNGGLGIDLAATGAFGPNGVTANDSGDSDAGSNNLQNFPVLTSVISNGGGTSIQGTLNSTPNTTFQIDFYSNVACDPSGNGEGASFFDSTAVTTDANGNATINFASSVVLPAGRALTATATDPAGNTSEFSPCDATKAIGNLQFSVATYNVLEDVGSAVITVLRHGSSGALSINYNTADGTAIAGSDYTAVSGTLNFAAGETSKTFTIPIANDGLSEVDETVQLTLTGFTDVETMGNPINAKMVIQESSTQLFLIMTSIDVPEGNSGTTNRFVEVTLSAQTGQTVTANWNTSNQTATGGVDFIAGSGSIAFTPGVNKQTIPVSVIGDTLNENNETFQVMLTNIVNATIFQFAIVRILDDDPLRIDSVTPVAGRASGGQQLQITGAFARLSTVRIGGNPTSWFGNSSTITITTPAHAVGAVPIELTPSSGSVYLKPNAFAYLPTVFTDNTLTVGVTTAKAQHVLELRQAVDALRAVAGLAPAPWTDATLTPFSTNIKAIHIQELRSYLDQVATTLGYSTTPYTDPSLVPGITLKRVHIEELRQRIRTIAG